MGFFSQTGILLQKTFLLAVRNWKATIVQILAPIVLCAMLFGTLTDDCATTAMPLSPPCLHSTLLTSLCFRYS